MASDERKIPRTPEEWAAWAALKEQTKPTAYPGTYSALEDYAAAPLGHLWHGTIAAPPVKPLDPRREEWISLSPRFRYGTPAEVDALTNDLIAWPGPLIISGIGAEAEVWQSSYGRLTSIVAARGSRERTTLLYSPYSSERIKTRLERQRGGADVWARFYAVLSLCDWRPLT